MPGSEPFCSCCGRQFEGVPAGISFGNVLVRTHGAGLELKVGHRTIELRMREAEILKRLLRSRGQPVHRESLFFSVWGADSEVEWKIMDVVLCSLRKKLVGTGMVIETIRAFGFKLTVNEAFGEIKRRAA